MIAAAVAAVLGLWLAWEVRAANREFERVRAAQQLVDDALDRPALRAVRPTRVRAPRAVATAAKWN